MCFFHSVWFLNHWHDFSRFMIANKFMVLHFVYIKSFLPFFLTEGFPVDRELFKVCQVKGA